jgi:AcrR family transcriptional regulator
MEAAATHRRIIDRAAEMGSFRGLEGVTIGVLAEDLGMSKAGVLGHFGTKQALQLAAVDQAALVFTQVIVEPGLAQTRGVARLLAWCDAWINYLEGNVFPGGCFFTAASCEFDGRPGPVRERIVEHIARWLSMLEREIDFARTAGELPFDLNAEKLAMELNGMVMAANQSFQLLGNDEGFDLMRRALREHLRPARSQQNGIGIEVESEIPPTPT